jgi:hypothetical protein
MALPKLASAKYELKLPSTGEKIEYRPFLVKEEKMLLQAQSTGKQEDQIRAVGELVSACTFDKIDPKKAPLFDLEYVFLKIRSKSIGAIVNLKVTCPDDGESKCDVELNLDDINVIKSDEHTTDIKIADNIGIVMNYPRMDMIDMIDDNDEGGTLTRVLKSCISQIYDADNVYARSDIDEKELEEFIDSMSHDQFVKVQGFFDTIPKLKHTIKVKNPNTGVESDVVLEGLNAFFQ